MSVELRIAPEAIDDAYAWYDERRTGLGAEFLSCLDACIQAISRWPESHPAVFQSYRRALVRRFPYAVFYEVQANNLTVYGVFHTSRDSSKWRERLP